MNIRLTAPLALFVLAACDGNPLGTGQDDGGGDGGTPDTRAGAVYGDAVDVDDLSMNSLVYDAARDELIVNNIPFDGVSAANGQAAYVNTGALPNGYGLYESVETAETGRRQYYAVFRRSTSGFSQAAAVGTDDYIGFGFGGVTAQSNTASVALPGGGEYVYTGEYAAVRTFDKAEAGAPNEVQYVTGDVELDVDIRDFDVTGAVEGIIDNRMLYAQDGSFIGVLDDYVALATGEIDTDTLSVTSSNAFGVSFSDASTITTGNWAAVFAGPRGQEIAGIVVLEGTVTPDADSGTVRETGVFIAID